MMRTPWLALVSALLAVAAPAAVLARGKAKSTAIPAVLAEGLSPQPGTAAGYPYLLHIPSGYSAAPNRQWPVLVFLHGSGESGTDLEKVKVHGPPRLAAGDPAFPFIVIAPQTPSAQLGWDPARLDAMLDSALPGLKVDRSRVYLTGLSMGGIGAWRWAAVRPDRFAAVAPVAARGDLQSVCTLRQMPLWAFHGDDDTVVGTAEGIAMVTALRACGGKPRLTIYPATGHDSWSETYADPALYMWLLRQHREAD